MLATWLSYDDLERLVVASLSSPVVGFSVIYGMSDNPVVWWDNASAKHIGFKPKDTSFVFKDAVESRQLSLDLNDPAVIYQGGGFVKNAPI
jgi:uronate dehydrogenase